MKKLYYLILLVSFSSAVHSQPYGNEWIKFIITDPYSQQKYLKIQVWQEGIHRISYNDINQFIPDTINPQQFQIFHKGVEQFIYVYDGATNNVFDPADYIEFYAKRNDGSFDTLLYDSASFQLNPFYSLFNDTAAYFFTINSNVSTINRRMNVVIDTNFPNYTPPADFVLKDVWQEYHNDYFSGYADASVDASYSKGEGFSDSNTHDGSTSFTIPLPAPNSYSGGNAPQTLASTILLGANYGGNPYQRDWTVSVNNQQYVSFSYNNYALNRYEAAFNLSGASINFLYNPNVTCTCQRNTVPYVRAIYPHTLSFSGENSTYQKFTVKGDPTAIKTRLDISNFSNATTAWLYIFNGDSITKVNVGYSNNLHQTLIPTYGTDKLCVLSSDPALTTGHLVSTVSSNPDPTTFTNYMFNTYNPSNFPEYDYIIISHKNLMTQAGDYKAYRQLISGGNYKVLLADINELYDQFACGINQHPLAVRNFSKFALDNFNVDPSKTRYLFLIGKAIRPELARLYPGSYYNLNAVPTYGNPPSDVIFTSRMTDTIFHPAFATGRLPAWNTQDVTIYLNKMIEHDIELTTPPAAWKKQVLHFGGGSNSTEQAGIKLYLEEYKSIIEDTLFAGNVTSFYKTTTDPIEANQSAFLQNLIDTGVTIMTFFSHAAGSSFDITTDVPENWDNKKRYPLMIANSCYIGDIHTATKQASEQFVLIADKGAIGFIASPNIGYIFEQPEYTRPLYRNIASYDYGKSIGEIMKHTIDSTFLGEPYRKSITMGMTLNGDPALKLYSMGKPDLEVTQPGVFFTPANITTEIDSFQINVVIRNLGRAIDKDYYLRVTRKYPDGGADKIFDTLIQNMPFIDTISIYVAMDFARASGLNTFDVMADASQPQLIDEFNETNNSVITSLMIRSSDINPVYPFKYAIIPGGTDVKLKASTANLFAPLTAYRFEIDTVDRFNSNFKRVADISSIGGIVTWTLNSQVIPQGKLDSNRVYYWRVANAKILTDPANYNWRESSFIYKPGKTGWSQAHYSQFKEDEFRNIVYADSMPPAANTFEFVNTASTILCHTSLTPNQLGGHPVDYFINNNLMASGGCSYNEFHLAVLDSITLVPWRADKTIHDLGNYNKYDPATQTGPCCAGYAPSYFLYPTWDTASTYTYSANLASALLNSIPDNNYILIYTLGGSKYPLWHPSLAPAFAALGGTPNANADMPFIYFTKKGSGQATIIYADTASNKDITFDTIVGGNWDKGFITSIQIGPATHWTQLHWGQHTLEPSNNTDSIDVSVIGITHQNTETVLIANLPPSIPDSSLTFIDANVYPYLKLESYHQDVPQHTPPQLDRWQIYYEEVPEAALAPNKWFQPNPFADSTDEGAHINLEMAVENISSRDMDSMLVDFYVYDKNHVRTNISSPRYKKLPAGDTLIAKVSFDTKNFTGLNSLWIEANPHNDQPEQYHFNNIAELLFNVNRDITNPILDVTFDGQHILDGDIVSAKPFIFIKVKDENKYIAMNDTAKFPVKITDPNGKVSRVYFENVPNVSTDRNKLKWTPAILEDGPKPDNSFKIEFTPEFPVDGIYQLEVQGSDEAGNLSGAYAYRISFEVINRSTITNFINYPNPFSTSTKFVFTLTGSEVPSYMKIQIMTVSGKIVREITQNEIGNVHIGRNITEYAWDGKDEYGDRLANGVYLYRVITQLFGQSIEHRDTEADHFFKKGWGKMVILR